MMGYVPRDLLIWISYANKKKKFEDLHHKYTLYSAFNDSSKFNMKYWTFRQSVSPWVETAHFKAFT